MDARKPQTILVCRCGGAAPPLDGALFQNREGLELLEITDLCELAERRDPLLRRATSGPLTVFACHARAVRWLFQFAGVPLPAQTELVTHFIPPVPRPGPPDMSDWIPWYPVIDYSRCRKCGQCAGFCLFGTYELLPAGEVVVRQPRHCKTYCPACARVCPHSAIIFPKCGENPINGAPLDATTAVAAQPPVFFSALGTGDARAMLLERRQALQRRLLRPAAIIPEASRPAAAGEGET